jgi:hypothetical protein
MAPVCCTRNTADSRYWTGSDPNAPNAHSSTFYVIGYASVSSSSRQIQLFLTYRSHSAEPSWRTLYTSSCTMARSRPAGSCIRRCFNRYSLPNYASMTQRAEVDCSIASERISRGWTLAWPITVSTDAIKADNSHTQSRIRSVRRGNLHLDHDRWWYPILDSRMVSCSNIPLTTAVSSSCIIRPDRSMVRPPGICAD